jgi:imidazolonepropionase
MRLAVIGCGELVTLRGAARPRRGAEMRELSIVLDGAMLIRNGRIEAVGPRAEVEARIDAGCEVVDAGGRVVMPGFVDAHTHPVFAGTRAGELEQRAAGLSYQEIAAAGGGIRSTVRLTRAASEDELVEAGQRFAGWFLRCGTTTIEGKSGYGLTVDDELKMLRAIRRLAAETRLRYVPTFLGAHIVPDEYREKRSEYVSLVMDEMLPRVAGEGLAEYCDAFCEAGAFSIDESERILTRAKGLGLKLRVHADQLTPGEGAQLAARLGAMTADHLEHTGLAGIEVMAAAGVQPVLLPGSVFAIGGARYPAARAMIEKGLAVVIATDFNPGSSPTPSMPLALSIAVRQMGVMPAEALTAGTVNAAYSIGRGGEMGSLEVGKVADFVVWDCRDWREVVYFFGVEMAAEVYVGGSRVGS